MSGFLFHKAAGSLSLRKLNIVSWIFYYQLLLLSFIGITLGMLGVPHYMLARGSEASMRMAYFAVCYVMVVMPLTMIFFQRLALGGSIRAKLYRYFAKRLQPLQSKKDSSQLLFWGAMTFVTFLATVYVYYTVRELPFLSLLGSSDSSFLSLRQSAKFEFEGNVYIRNFFSLLLAPLVSYIAFSYLLLRPNPVHVLWFLFTMFVALMAITYSGEKAPPINYLIVLFFIYSIVRGRFRLWQLAAMGLTGACLIALLYLVTSGSLPLALNAGPIGRLLFSQIAPLSLHFELFPDPMPFLQGASFPNWMLGPFGLEHLRSSRAVMEVFNARLVETGEAGVMNTLFIGEAWANFGWTGYLLAPVIAGIVVQFIHNLFLSLPKSPVFVALLAYFMFGLPITGGFVDFIWNVGWLFLLLLVSSSLYIRPILLDAKRADAAMSASSK